MISSNDEIKSEYYKYENLTKKEILAKAKRLNEKMLCAVVNLS